MVGSVLKEPEEPDMVCEGEPGVVSDGISVVSPGTPMDLDGADPKRPMSATQTPASEVSPAREPEAGQEGQNAFRETCQQEGQHQGFRSKRDQV